MALQKVALKGPYLHVTCWEWDQAGWVPLGPCNMAHSAAPALPQTGLAWTVCMMCTEEDSEAPTWSKLKDLKLVNLTLQNTEKHQREEEVSRALRQYIVACFQIQTDSLFLKRTHLFYFYLLCISLSSFGP